MQLSNKNGKLLDPETRIACQFASCRCAWHLRAACCGPPLLLRLLLRAALLLLL